MNNWKLDRHSAIQWARSILDSKETVLLLDTETSDLSGEVIELAIADTQGRVRYNQRFKPVLDIHPKAEAVHGLSKSVLADEPDFCEEYETVKAILESGALVVIFNADFDDGILKRTCEIRGLAPFRYASNCAMLRYAEYVGDWNDYFGNYRWKKLPDLSDGPAHSALADVLSTLEVLKLMATSDE